MAQPLQPPIVASSTFSFPNSAELLRALNREGPPLYSRWDNPTVQETEGALAELMGAEGALAFGSGMAAISSALLCALAERPRLLCQAEVYGGTYELVRELLPTWGIEVVWFRTHDWQQALAASQAPVGAVLIETPTNPTLRLTDIEAVAQAAHTLGALLLVDNTFASPLNQRPLALGADVELHSASKYLGGHHDLIAGVVAGKREFLSRLWQYRKLLGGILDPFPAYLLFRGLQTLSVRVRQQNETAAQLAHWLHEQPQVVAVHYPGLSSHPQHALAQQQMAAGGGMLSFEVAGGLARATQLMDSFERVLLAPSLGGTVSTACLPATSSHHSLSAAEREQVGVSDSLVRLSVGLEPYESLREDLEQALSARPA